MRAVGFFPYCVFNQPRTQPTLQPTFASASCVTLADTRPCRIYNDKPLNNKRLYALQTSRWCTVMQAVQG